MPHFASVVVEVLGLVVHLVLEKLVASAGIGRGWMVAARAATKEAAATKEVTATKVVGATRGHSGCLANRMDFPFHALLARAALVEEVESSAYRRRLCLLPLRTSKLG